MRLRTLLTLIGCALLMAACGIKGPLYLPEVPARVAPQSGIDHSKLGLTYPT